MDNEDVQKQLKRKYPERSRNIAMTVIKGQCVENLSDLKERLKNLPRAVAP